MSDELGNLIGVGGRLAAGKDTVADYLVDFVDWVKFGMSDPLHEAMSRLNPWIPIEIQSTTNPGTTIGTGLARYVDYVDDVGYTAAKENPEVRRLLQKLGTEVGREMFGENVWVDYARNKINEARERGENVVITGIRFPNEAGMIQANGAPDNPGILVWVERPQELDSDSAGHASESLTSEGFDVIVINDGTINDLYTSIEDQILAEIEK